MKINKAELQSALEIVRPGLANKDLIEQSTSFAFMGDRVVTYNDEISISHPIKGLDVTGAIKADALYQFLSKVKQDEIEIDWKDQEVQVTAGHTKAGLVFEAEVRLPVDEIGEIGKWKKLPEGVLDAFRTCHPCASKDMSRPMLTCLHVDKSGKVEAADSHQIIRASIGTKLPVKSFLLPATSARELVRYKVNQIAEGEGWVHFQTEEGTVFSCRVFDGDFPDVTPMLTVEDGKEVTFSKKVLEALGRAEVFATTNIAQESEIGIVMEENKVTITAKNESGWFEESLKVRYTGDPMTFRTSPELLANGLRQGLTCLIGPDKIKFSGENWECVVAASVDDGKE